MSKLLLLTCSLACFRNPNFFVHEFGPYSENNPTCHSEFEPSVYLYFAFQAFPCLPRGLKVAYEPFASSTLLRELNSHTNMAKKASTTFYQSAYSMAISNTLTCHGPEL